MRVYEYMQSKYIHSIINLIAQISRNETDVSSIEL